MLLWWSQTIFNSISTYHGCNMKPSNVHTCICVHTHLYPHFYIDTHTHQKHQQFLWFEFPFDLSFAICVFTEWCWSIATLFSLHFAYISTHSTFAFSFRDRGNAGTRETDNLRQRRRQIFGEISTTFLTIVIILNYFIFSARNKSFWLLLLLLRLVVMLVMVLQRQRYEQKEKAWAFARVMCTLCRYAHDFKVLTNFQLI